MKLHLFLCLDFAKIRVRTIDQKRQNFSLFDRKTLCITQLQCKLISNYFIYLIHVYFKSHTWYMQECCRTRISSSRLAFSTGTNVKVQKPCITMIECLDKCEVPILSSHYGLSPHNEVPLNFSITNKAFNNIDQISQPLFLIAPSSIKNVYGN